MTFLRRMLESNHGLLCLAGVLVFAGITASVWWHDFMWLARFGSLLVAIGVALLARTSFTGQDLRVGIKMADTGLSQLDPEHYRRLGEPMPDWLVRELRDRLAVGLLGPLVSALGTLLWGFADLLNRL